MELFSQKPKKRRRDIETDIVPVKPSINEDDDIEDIGVETLVGEVDDGTFATSFNELGVCEWLCDSCSALGIRQPTPVQRCCIPATLNNFDIIGLAETGSGKTAAFAIPMLQRLSEDPYGVFALVLTPTRELAIQIAEQIAALGAPIGVRVCTIIGGVNMTVQSLELANQPHFVVATPGRLIDHIEGSRPPSFERLSFLVLDEADRILATGFAPELTKVLQVLPESKTRQTLFFSATMSDAITKLREMASKRRARLFNLTVDQATPTSLTLEYIFMPAQVKLSFVVQILRTLLKLKHKSDSSSQGKGGKGKGKGKGGKKQIKNADLSDDEEEDSDLARSAIIFVGSCKRCQEVNQVLLELGVDSVCLHSLLDQRRRLAALGRFKSLNCRILVATDVASRGLDIPDVDIVINYDMPRLPVDFVHRSGRTARAGRAGRSLSLVTQHDVELVHAVEEHVDRKLVLYEGVTNDDVLPLLNVVAKAQRVARQRLSEVGFDEQVAALKKRAKKRREFTEKFKKESSTSEESEVRDDRANH